MDGLFWNNSFRFSEAKGTALQVTFEQILQKYRDISFSEQGKGYRFERLMQSFLKTYRPTQSFLLQFGSGMNFPPVTTLERATRI